MAEPSTQEAAGAAVDSEGRAARDPTDNVLDLARAAAQRADDLREQADRYRLELEAKDAIIEVWKFRWLEERDRRLTEVGSEREKALKIKEDGDKEARRIKEAGDKEAGDRSREAQRDRDEAAAKVAELVLAQTTRDESAVSARTNQAVNLNLVIALAGLLVVAGLGVAAIVFG